MNQFECDYIFKFFLVGSKNAGKSSLLLRYLDDTYSDEPITPNVDFKLKMLTINDSRIKLQVWDVFRNHLPTSLLRIPYRGTHLVLLVYDITNIQSFIDICREWYNEVARYCRDDVLITLVGTKLDLVDMDNGKRQVSYEFAKMYADKMDWDFYEISSKYNYNINECMANSTIRTYNLFINQLNEQQNGFSNINNKITSNNNNTNNNSNNNNNNYNKKDCIIN